MALMFNGTSPTEINFVHNGTTTSLTKVQVVKNGTTTVVWEKGMKTLSPPVVLRADFGNQQDIIVEVSNINNVDVACYVTFYDVNDTVYGSGSFLMSANYDSAVESIPLDSSGEFESGAYIRCYFTASGYTQSRTTTHIVYY